MSVNIHPDSKQLKSVDGVVYNKDMTELIYFPRGKIQIEGQENSVFEIPDTVVKICDNAFLYNNSLRKVIIPSSVKTIGESAFEESKYIKEIVFSEGLSTIKSNAFSKCQALESVSLPSTLKYIETMSLRIAPVYKAFQYLPIPSLTILAMPLLTAA